MLRTSAVSLISSTTRACCHVSRPRTAVLSTGHRNLVAVALPEPGLVVGPELDAADPLRALPEIEVWNQQARRAAVLRVKRFTRVLVRDPCLPVTEVLEGE